MNAIAVVIAVFESVIPKYKCAKSDARLLVEPLHSSSTVASFAESILDNMWVICNETDGASKKDSPKDEGNNNSPEGSNSPS